MKVPRSAAGKMGMCPACGKKIPIGRGDSPVPGNDHFSDPWRKDSRKKWTKGATPDEAAKRDFGRAADLYCEGRFGEALAVFDALARRYPDSQEIQSARAQCVVSRNRKPIELPEPSPDQLLGGEFNEETERLVKQVLLDKMLNASSESVQVQAAELIARMMGLFQDRPSHPEPNGRDQGGNTGHSGADHETGQDRDRPPIDMEWPADAAFRAGSGHRESS